MSAGKLIDMDSSGMIFAAFLSEVLSEIEFAKEHVQKTANTLPQRHALQAGEGEIPAAAGKEQD